MRRARAPERRGNTVSDPGKLIADYLDDALTEADRESLNAWLAIDRANVRRFTDALLFEEQIRGAARAHAAQRAAEDIARKSRERARSDARDRKASWMRPAWTWGAAAALFILGMSLWLTRPEKHGPVVVPADSVSESAWTVPTDALLNDAPATARLSEEISALLQP